MVLLVFILTADNVHWKFVYNLQGGKLFGNKVGRGHTQTSTLSPRYPEFTLTHSEVNNRTNEQSVQVIQKSF